MVRGLTLFVTDWVETIKEEAVAKRVSMQCVGSIELNEVYWVKKLLSFDVLNESNTWKALEWDLKHWQHDLPWFRVQDLFD